MFHWNLQETPDPTNPFDSFLVKALLSSIVLLEITILGNGNLGKPGIEKNRRVICFLVFYKSGLSVFGDNV